MMRVFQGKPGRSISCAKFFEKFPCQSEFPNDIADKLIPDEWTSVGTILLPLENP